MIRATAISVLVLSLAVATGAQQTARPGSPQQPARDTSAQPSKDAPPTPTGRITGRVVTTDTGRPVKRARVFAAAAELPGGRGVLTDDSGVFDLTELPAGRYTLTVSKTGFISLSYGQRRPLQAGTPLQLAEGQQLKGVDFSLPRGGVIAGHVLNEDGEAMPGVIVRILRYQYLQGDRRLTPAGTAQTDDLGQYRVWGLMPGDYYVNALTRLPGIGGGGGGGRGGGRGGGAPGGPGGIAGAVAAIAGGNVAALFAGDDQEAVNYAPTYFPGVAAINEAQSVTVGVSQQVLDINFSLLLVRTSRVSGHVANPDGTPTSSGNVNLMPDGPVGRGGQIGVNYSGRIQWDGAFSLANVPPGRYTLRARGDDAGTPQYGLQPVSLTGMDVDDMTVVLSNGATLTGTIAFQPGSAAVPDPTQVRITAPSTDQSAFGGPQPTARVDTDGHFSLAGVPAGPHLIRPGGNMRGWSLKSVTIDGRDVTDTPIELRSAQNLANVAIVFTDKLSEINGKVTDQQDVPVPDFTVLAFSTDPTVWRPQSRQIMTARPDQTGQYRIRGLPPGDYYVATVDPAEQGEWFEPAYLDEHRIGAAHLTLSEGDVKTKDFKVALK
jgi:hypothetical protein